jgi:hypothetical protein
MDRPHQDHDGTTIPIWTLYCYHHLLKCKNQRKFRIYGSSASVISQQCIILPHTYTEYVRRTQYIVAPTNLSYVIVNWSGMKTVRIFSDRIQDRIRLEGFRSVRIRVQIFNIRYRIRIRILKSYIYDVNIQSYPIRHDWHYPYPNPTRNMKTNMISMISVRIWSVFIPGIDQLHPLRQNLKVETWDKRRAFVVRHDNKSSGSRKAPSAHLIPHRLPPYAFQ